MEKKQVVLPGDFLSTEEEFGPGKNSFDSDGGIYSNVIGIPMPDNRAKEVSVKPFAEIRRLGPGSIVLGRISLVKENSAMVDLAREGCSSERLVISPASAMIPVRETSQQYVETMRDCFRVGDIVKARVARVLPDGSIDLATAEPEFGVIKAFCSRCRQPLHLFGQGLRCLSCGSSEGRKISRDYYVK